MYTDIGLFTARPAIVEDVSDLFNYLTGYSSKADYASCWSRRCGLRERLRELIEREARARGGQGRRAHHHQGQRASTDRRSSARSTARRRPACRST